MRSSCQATPRATSPPFLTHTPDPHSLPSCHPCHGPTHWCTQSTPATHPTLGSGTAGSPRRLIHLERIHKVLRVAPHPQLVAAPLLALRGRQVAGEQVHERRLACGAARGAGERGRKVREEAGERVGGRRPATPPQEARAPMWRPRRQQRGMLSGRGAAGCGRGGAQHGRGFAEHGHGGEAHPLHLGPRWPPGCPCRCLCSCPACQSRRGQGT